MTGASLEVDYASLEQSAEAYRGVSSTLRTNPLTVDTSLAVYGDATLVVAMRRFAEGCQARQDSAAVMADHLAEALVAAADDYRTEDEAQRDRYEGMRAALDGPAARAGSGAVRPV